MSVIPARMIGVDTYHSAIISFEVLVSVSCFWSNVIPDFTYHDFITFSCCYCVAFSTCVLKE